MKQAAKAKPVRAPERQFRIEFVVGERRVGAMMAELDGVAGLEVHLLKEAPESEKNFPRGTYAEAIKETLGEKHMSKVALLDELVHRGLPRKAVDQALWRMKQAKEVRVTGKNGAAMVQLAAGAKGQ